MIWRHPKSQWYQFPQVSNHLRSSIYLWVPMIWRFQASQVKAPGPKPSHWGCRPSSELGRPWGWGNAQTMLATWQTIAKDELNHQAIIRLGVSYPSQKLFDKDLGKLHYDLNQRPQHRWWLHSKGNFIPFYGPTFPVSEILPFTQTHIYIIHIYIYILTRSVE